MPIFNLRQDDKKLFLIIIKHSFRIRFIIEKIVGILDKNMILVETSQNML